MSTPTPRELTRCPSCGGDGSKANAYLLNCVAIAGHRMGGFVWVARRCPEENPDLFVRCWLDAGHAGPHNMEGARNQRWRGGPSDTAARAARAATPEHPERAPAPDCATRARDYMIGFMDGHAAGVFEPDWSVEDVCGAARHKGREYAAGATGHPEAAAVDRSRSSHNAGAAALTPTLAAPTGAAAPTRCETTLTERLDASQCVGCGTYAGNLGPCATWLEGEVPGRCVYCDHTNACHPAPSADAFTPAHRARRVAASPAGRAPQWSDEYWQLDQAVMDAEELPRPEAQIAVLRSIRDRWDALSAAGRAPARAGTTPELIEAWQALAEYRAENARLRAEVSRLSADRAGGA